MLRHTYIACPVEPDLCPKLTLERRIEVITMLLDAQPVKIYKEEQMELHIFLNSTPDECVQLHPLLSFTSYYPLGGPVNCSEMCGENQYVPP